MEEEECEDIVDFVQGLDADKYLTGLEVSGEEEGEGGGWRGGEGGTANPLNDNDTPPNTHTHTHTHLQSIGSC